MDILDYVIEKTSEYIAQMPKAVRKRYGQFFTSRETAAFMAGLFTIPNEKREWTILDPGAGSGVLSAALAERLLSQSLADRVHLVCFETDENILPLLEENLSYMRRQSSVPLTYQVNSGNYILSQQADYNGWIGADPHPPKYDLVIANPPYIKLSRNAPEAKAMPDVCYGTPNLYFLFASMSLFNLRDGGEMAYLIPRSWTSGAYFRRFREKLLSSGSLSHVHLFASRDRVFRQETVLQETVIIKVRKALPPPSTVRITATPDSRSFDHLHAFDAPYSAVVSGRERYVHLAAEAGDLAVLNRLGQFSKTLPDLGLNMKTGLTVDFRNQDLLRDEEEGDAVPLFHARHIRNGRISFPDGREHEYLLAKQPGLLQPNANYLFVKRFTTKEEARRLQCGVCLARQRPEYERISTDNKINFIGSAQGLSECAAYGLYVIFNSSFYDRYYRILDGSTQVNATEINSMPVPPMEAIERMGRELASGGDLSVPACDRILESYL